MLLEAIALVVQVVLLLQGLEAEVHACARDNIAF